MLASVVHATSLPNSEVEILCSWNGDLEGEKEINNSSGYEFLIAQRTPYHFAGNMNSLSMLANGEYLLLINDDVILDSNSIEAAMNCLINESKAGIVGSRLRDQYEQITHAGIVFDNRHSPYHLLDKLVPADAIEVSGGNRIVPAVTGALILISRDNFSKLLFNESYRVCGEDVELCIDLRKKLQLEVWYSPAFSGIHEAESTRKVVEEQGGNSEDLGRLRKLHRQFIEEANIEQLRHEMISCRNESQALRSLTDKWNEYGLNIKSELAYWQEQTHSLQLTRLRQKDEIDNLKRKVQNLELQQSKKSIH